MVRIKSIPSTKPFRSDSVGARTAKEAASRLARLEFDIARLEREIELADERASRGRDELTRRIEQRDLLIGIISRKPKVLGKPLNHGT